MTDRVKGIIENINIDKEESIARGLDQIADTKSLTDEEKVDLAPVLATIFYHDHAGKPDMTRLANRAEKQIARFGESVLKVMAEELIDADPESAAHIGRAIALIGGGSVDTLLASWDSNIEDDFAIINIMQALSYFRSDTVIKAIPKILDAAGSKNHQLRAAALYTAGKLTLRLSSEAFGEKLQLEMFDISFKLLSDNKPLVRKDAARALGKMLKKGILHCDQKKKVFNAFNAILGNDEQHEWDNAFIVRHEAEHFLPYCKEAETLADKYKQSYRIITKKELCDKTFHFTIEAPFIANKLKAGQFIIVRPHEQSERIPLSICGWDTDAGTIHIIVMAVGKTSSEINAMNVGDCFTDIVGPLGERSHVKKHEGTCVVIGGGYGTGAIIPTARDLKALGNKVIGIVGARNKDLLLMMDELGEVCDEVRPTTNDGSAGTEGLVTDVLKEIMNKEKVSHVLAVGPVPMMKAVSEMTRPDGIETFVSLNAIMVDGTGMCGACRVSVGGETKFACFHGPDFNGHDVDFDQLVKRQRMFVEEEKKALATLAI
jgi:ferredoxin--NADP+ reductase